MHFQEIGDEQRRTVLTARLNEAKDYSRAKNDELSSIVAYRAFSIL